MKINHSNIEAYLLDYMEGNLDPMITAEIMAFLTEHPEYEKCMPELDFLMPVAVTAKYPFKDALKKDFSDIPQIHAGNFEEFCIAYSEKILQQSDIDRLYRYIGSDSGKQKILSLYKKMHVIPDEKIKFIGKSQLKKPVPFVLHLPRVAFLLSIAAMLMLVYFLVKPHSNNEYNPVAHHQPTGKVNPTSEVVIDIPEPENTGNSAVQHIAVPLNKTTTPPMHDTKTISGSTHEPETFTMESLEPITINSLPPAENAFPITSPVLSKPDKRKRDDTYDTEPEGLLNTLLARVDMWKTAKTAIEGFNQLTEAQVSISKTYDEHGRVTGMLFNTESYSIESSSKK